VFILIVGVQGIGAFASFAEFMLVRDFLVKECAHWWCNSLIEDALR
jgi:hypothetical protein